MAPEIPIVGQVLGHYRALEQIGAGGMGQVFRASDEQLERPIRHTSRSAQALTIVPKEKR
jgi:hypothetical protein